VTRRLVALLLTGVAVGAGTRAGAAAPTAAERAAARSAPATLRTAPPLSGVIIALDPGHDGGNAAHAGFINHPVPNGIGGTKACDTVGTQTAGGYTEHAFTFDVVRRAAALMRAAGATVVLTRRTDTGVGPCVDVRARIGNRGAGRPADLAFSVHADGGPPGGRGFHVIKPAYHAGSPVDRVLTPSGRLAGDLVTAMVRDTGMPRSTYVGGGTGLVARTDLAGLMLSRVPKVFVEAANMRNVADAASCRSATFRERVARALLDAAIGFVRQSRTPPRG
jgi:N-acetylmuramoyl-L-alanine amidase